MALNVMIVDNEETIRKGLASCIHWENMGCTIVAQAADGIEALELLPQAKPDIVISDIRMPGMDGLELSNALHCHHPDIKVIILTGFPDFRYAQKAIGYGVVDFVLKPTSVESLTAAVEKAKQLILEEKSHLTVYQKLANQNEENLTLQRVLFLNELIHANQFSSAYIYSKLKQLHLDLQQYHVICVSILMLQEDEGSAAKKPLQETQTVLENLLKPSPVCFIPRGEQSSYVVVPGVPSSTLLSVCTEAANIVSSLFACTPSFGISSLSVTPLQMRNVAAQARQARQFAEYLGRTPAVVGHGEIPAAGKEELDGIAEDLRHLKLAMERQNPVGAEAIFRRIFEQAHAAGISAGGIRTIYIYIYNFCIGIVFENNIEDGVNTPLFTLPDILLGGESTEEDLLFFIKDMLLRAEPTKNPGAVVSEVKRYVSLHYREDLSLENLASMVHLSPTYLSRFFKKETGENLSLYIQNMRVEKAKELLANTSMKSYEVAEAVGIHDPVYFSRIFKKITGLKPKDYRNT